MPLYRALYIRQDRVRGITFWATHVDAAVSFTEHVLQDMVGKDTPIISLNLVQPKRSAARAKRWAVKNEQARWPVERQQSQHLQQQEQT